MNSHKGGDKIEQNLGFNWDQFEKKIMRSFLLFFRGMIYYLANMDVGKCTFIFEI